MTRKDPNLAQVELIANAIGDLRERLVFVGGCAVGLLITDSAAAPVRVTYDVDLIVQVTALPGYYQVERDFSKLGFQRDVSVDAPICRWKYRDIVVDLMPTDTSILGFSNRWYPLAVETAQLISLRNNQHIKLISAPVFLATKFEAFADRGNRDILSSHDFEDIINVIDGRAELSGEIESSSEELRRYLGEQCKLLLSSTSFLGALPGLVFPDEFLAQRVREVEYRVRRIATFDH